MIHSSIPEGRTTFIPSFSSLGRAAGRCCWPSISDGGGGGGSILAFFVLPLPLVEWCGLLTAAARPGSTTSAAGNVRFFASASFVGGGGCGFPGEARNFVWGAAFDCSCGIFRLEVEFVWIVDARFEFSTRTTFFVIVFIFRYEATSIDMFVFPSVHASVL